MIDEYIRNNARRFADRTTVQVGDHGVTFAELDASVDAMVARLAAAGATKGARVAVLGTNSIAYIQVLLAALRSGVIAVPINTRLAGPEIRYILDDAQPALLVTDEAHESLAEEAIAPGAPVHCMIMRQPWQTAEPASAAPTPEPTPELGDPALILYTSGTTGRPKGAVISHLALLVNSLSVLGRLGMHDPNEWRHLGVPLFHSGGINSVLQQLLLGGPLVLMPDAGFDPVATLDVLERHQVATAFFAPTQWQAICNVPDVQDRKLSLKRLIWGTSSTPRHILELMNATFKDLPVFAQFGQTETCGTTCTLGPEYASSKLGSAGRPLTHVQMRLVDPEMRDVAPGDVGEVVYRGPSLLTEYWNNPEATAAAFEGGWFHSGDLGRLDEDGFLSIIGRLKEMIVSGGENIYPLEVEAAIVTHPKVREVAVVGLPHPRWMETPVAAVVPTDPSDPPTLQELQEHVRASLASFKKPTAVYPVAQLPRNAMGKVVKATIRDDLNIDRA